VGILILTRIQQWLDQNEHQLRMSSLMKLERGIPKVELPPGHALK